MPDIYDTRDAQRRWICHSRSHPSQSCLYVPPWNKYRSHLSSTTAVPAKTPDQHVHRGRCGLWSVNSRSKGRCLHGTRAVSWLIDAAPGNKARASGARHELASGVHWVRAGGRSAGAAGVSLRLQDPLERAETTTLKLLDSILALDERYGGFGNAEALNHAQQDYLTLRL